MALSGCKAAPDKTSPDSDVSAETVIYVTNDVHYLDKSLHDRGSRYQQVISELDGKNVELVDELLQALRFSAEADRPDILLLNGDLSYNGERASHRGLAEHLSAIEELGVKVYVIPGNHDINNPYARSFFNDHAAYTEKVTAKQFSRIYGDFGYREAISRDKHTLSYVAEPTAKLRLLMLDTNKYNRNSVLKYPEASGAISPETRTWIRKAADQAKKDGAAIVAAMHHSLMDHHPMVNEGFTVDDAASVRELFAELGIQFVLSGHIHAQEISQRQTTAGPIYDIATSALSVFPHQIGILRRIPAETRWHYSVKPLPVEAWARASGATDPRLLNFAAYSETFFKRNAADMVTRRLSSPESAPPLTPEELAALAELMGTLNARYFSGTEYLNQEDIPQSAGYKLLETLQFDFLSNYARTIIDDPPPLNIELSIPLRNLP
jgi:3',5'-cyclic AMP phosphodiesterase CpdA